MTTETLPGDMHGGEEKGARGRVRAGEGKAEGGTGDVERPGDGAEVQSPADLTPVADHFWYPAQLPKHIDEEAILAAISLEKDVDGFHPENIGKLCMKGRSPLFVPCTPMGCMVLLERCGVEIKGKRAVVVGRSNIVGLPAAMLLNERDATVTIVHSRTQV